MHNTNSARTRSNYGLGAILKMVAGPSFSSSLRVEINILQGLQSWVDCPLKMLSISSTVAMEVLFMKVVSQVHIVSSDVQEFAFLASSHGSKVTIVVSPLFGWGVCAYP